MPHSRMLKIIVLVVTAMSVVVGGAVIFHRVRRADSVSNILPTRKIEADVDVLNDWRRIEIQDQVDFYIPSDFRSDAVDRTGGFRRFRTDSMEILMDYGLAQHVTTCVVQSNEMTRSKMKFETVRIDGREGRVERLDRIPFNLEDDAELAVKGFLICVPDVGDGTHEFAVIGKYKSEQDYQTLCRILDSI